MQAHSLTQSALREPQLKAVAALLQLCMQAHSLTQSALREPQLKAVAALLQLCMQARSLTHSALNVALIVTDAVTSE
jgi:hypothetical protein